MKEKQFKEHYLKILNGAAIEDFEVDDDATPEEIQNEAEDIAFEHFSWSFWDVTKERENE